MGALHLALHPEVLTPLLLEAPSGSGLLHFLRRSAEPLTPTCNDDLSQSCNPGVAMDDSKPVEDVEEEERNRLYFQRELQGSAAVDPFRTPMARLQAQLNLSSLLLSHGRQDAMQLFLATQPRWIGELHSTLRPGREAYPDVRRCVPLLHARMLLQTLLTAACTLDDLQHQRVQPGRLCHGEWERAMYRGFAADRARMREHEAAAAAVAAGVAPPQPPLSPSRPDYVERLRGLGELERVECVLRDF